MPSTSFVMVAEIHNVDVNNQRQRCLPHLWKAPLVTVAEIHNVDLNNQRQWCLPHLLLWWGRYTMLI